MPEPQGDRTGPPAVPKVSETLDRGPGFQQASDGKVQALGLHQGTSEVLEGEVSTCVPALEEKCLSHSDTEGEFRVISVKRVDPEQPENDQQPP